MIYLEGYYDHFNNECFLHRLTREEFVELFNDKKYVSVSDKEVEYIRSLVDDRKYTFYDKLPPHDDIRFIEIINTSNELTLNGVSYKKRFIIDKYDDEWWAVTYILHKQTYYYSIDGNDGLVELKDLFD